MAQARVLADRLIPQEGLAWDALRIAAGYLLLVLCAQVAVPWSPVPFTGQTFGVMLVACLLGSRRAAIVMVVYLAQGLAGLPVFQPFGLPGVARLAGPTGGYLLAYPLAAFVTGWLVERGVGRSLARLSAALLAGEVVIFTGGGVWLATVHSHNWSGALAAGVLPFIPFEVVKMALVTGTVLGIEAMRRRKTEETGSAAR